MMGRGRSLFGICCSQAAARLQPTAWLLLLGLLLSGCAATVPQSPALSGAARQEAEHSWQALRQQGCPALIEADLTLRWDSLAERGAVAARLLLGETGCKVSVVTPLGQPLLVLATDGAWFRLARVQDARGYEGSTAGRAWRRYLPPQWTDADLAPWLTGRPSAASDIEEVRTDPDGAGHWIVFPRPGGREHVLLDGAGEIVLRRLLTDAEDVVQLDVTYQGYLRQGDCLWPREIRVRGVGFATELTLRVREWTFPPSLAASALDFAFPQGFTVELLE